MANRFTNPLPFFDDETGLPYAGAKLFFYASGTATKLDTYSDAGLTIANTNPVVLDSAGRIPNAVFLQNLQYKVILAPSTDTDPPTSPIWTQDPVYTSDYSARAQFTSGSGSPNGTQAGTAGSATIPASAYWDYTNNILYICTTTGTALTAVWTAINASTAAAVVPAPQGYITPVSGTPIIASDSIAATAVYYTPYIGVVVPVYNGTSLVPLSIVSELQYTLTSSLVASNIYDLYIFLLNGVVTFGSGPSWSAGTAGSITAGSCARGSGSGGSALTKINGIWTNAVSMTMRYGNGTTTTTVDANQGTYVGSLFMDGSNGQVSCYRSWGQSRKWGIWNAYNRAPIAMQIGDSTASWVYTAGSVPQPIRRSNSAAGNTLAVFTGLAEEIVNVEFDQSVNIFALGNTIEMAIGIGWNSTSAYSGKVGNVGGDPTPNAQLFNAKAVYTAAPSLGLQNVNCLESIPVNTSAGAPTPTYYGTQPSMTMTAKYRG